MNDDDLWTRLGTRFSGFAAAWYLLDWLFGAIPSLLVVTILAIAWNFALEVELRDRRLELDEIRNRDRMPWEPVKR